MADYTADTDSETTVSDTLGSSVDFEVETAAVLARYSEYLAINRPTPPILNLYDEGELAASITCRNFDADNHSEAFRAVMELMYGYMSVINPSALLAYRDFATLTDGSIHPAVVTINFTFKGSLTEYHPFVITDEGCKFIEDADLSPTHDSSVEGMVDNLIRTFIRVRRSPFPPSVIMNWLMNRGHEVQFFGEHSLENIDVTNGF